MKLRPIHMSSGYPRILVNEGVVWITIPSMRLTATQKPPSSFLASWVAAVSSPEDKKI